MFSKCRACLSTCDNMRHISSNDAESKHFILMLTSLGNFEWLDDDRIPSYLCEDCETILQVSYDFQKQCQKSNKAILKILKSETFAEDPLEFDETLQKVAGIDVETGQVPIEEASRVIDKFNEIQDRNSKCLACGLDLSSQRALTTTHMAQAHKEVREKWCFICTFPDVKEETKSQSLPFEVFKTAKKLNFCKICNKTVPSLANHTIQLHDGSRGDQQPVRYVCHICNKSYKKKENLQVHVNVHLGKTRHKCSYCGKPARSRSDLRDHERTHTGEKPHNCDVCGKSFCQASALRTHMKQHTGRPEVCKICQKRFCRPSELKLHLRKHAGEKPFLCTQCGKAFCQKSHLTEHMKTHSKNRPFQCDRCDKAFKTKSLLTSHLQIHLGDKRFKCTVCSYACFKPYRLAQHMKQHSEEKLEKNEFVCKVCERGFTTQGMLNTHMSASHNVIL